LCKTIRKDNLHVLIYPEIGMDPMTIRLAALPLAPIQCISWGHPETSGLPAIDYFLSSDLMEPPDADEHYTEKLIRLPNLSIYYEPLDIPVADINRRTFGLRQNSILYLCCQSLYKYLPQYDEIYPRIAKRVNDCQFLFISHKSNCVTEQVRKRINQAFKKFGIDADDYIIFLPRLYGDEYYAINNLSDVYLDSICWSGCNSTLEALSFDLPVVTLPGELMRGRHSSAILTMMGVTETIVSTRDEYIDLAVRLGLDVKWRKQISKKIAANKHLVYRDKTCITALEDFLERVVKEKKRLTH
jgi:protein O-GlcNAc transferase